MGRADRDCEVASPAARVGLVPTGTRVVAPSAGANVAAFLFALLSSTPHFAAAKEPPPRCDLGQFVVDGAELFAEAAAVSGSPIRPRHVTGDHGHGRSISVVGTDVSIDGVCPATAARVRYKKSRTKIAAVWASCDGLDGKVQLRASIETAECALMTGRVRAKRARIDHRFTAARAVGGECGDEGTFDVIQREIFGPKGCRVETCHGSSLAGGLDLRWGAAHYALVGVPAANAAAAAAGKKRVVPGDPDASFLWQKLTGALADDEGIRMPGVGSPLGVLQLEVLRAWITAGAPAVGTVPEAPCLPKHTFEPAQPLAPPSGGVQFVLEGPTLQPGEEIEGCMWVQMPLDAAFVLGSVEYSINPGSHHFAVWEHERDTPPTTGIFDPNDVACFKQGARFSITLSGAPETPYFVDVLGAGIAKRLEPGAYLGLNPHYFNEFDVPIQVKAWVNLLPAAGPVAHFADTLLSLEGALDGRSSYSIFVPPFNLASHRLRWYNNGPVPLAIFKMSSHQHQRGTHFTAWAPDGTKVFENFDWAHPAILEFASPYVLAPGDYLEYQCDYDNGVTRPVRRCGDSRFDTGCTPGEPRAVTFGTTAQDEMCFLTGFYYTD